MNASKIANSAMSVDQSIWEAKVQFCGGDVNSVFMSVARSLIHRVAITLESGPAAVSFHFTGIRQYLIIKLLKAVFFPQLLFVFLQSHTLS